MMMAPVMQVMFLSLLLTPFLYSLVFFAVILKLVPWRRSLECAGFPTKSRPKGKLIWIHAVNLGESKVALITIRALFQKFPWIKNILLTCTDRNAASWIEKEAKDKKKYRGQILQQYAPLDSIFWVRRFLRYWKPNLAIRIESEFWPNLIIETAKTCPLLMLQARMSKKSFVRWRRFSFLSERIFSSFSLVVCQDDSYIGIFRSLGSPSCVSSGNLKLAQAATSLDRKRIFSLKKILGSHTAWLATSTHPKEEQEILLAHQILCQKFPHTILFLAPRYPKRSPKIRSFLFQNGFQPILHSAYQQEKELWEKTRDQKIVYLIDTFGDLPLFYELIKIVFVGGSLVPLGGKNIIEPASYGCSLLHGPYQSNISSSASSLAQVGASKQIQDSHDLAKEVSHLFQDEKYCKKSGASAKKYVEKNRRQPVKEMTKAIEPFLKRINSDTMLDIQ